MCVLEMNDGNKKIDGSRLFRRKIVTLVSY